MDMQFKIKIATGCLKENAENEKSIIPKEKKYSF